MRPKFEKQTIPDQCYVIAFDTLFQGWQAVTNELDNRTTEIALFTKEDAEQEMMFIDDDSYFIIHMDEYIDGRKCFIGKHEDGTIVGMITGYKPIKQ